MKMPIKLDLQTFYGEKYTFYIKSNDGSTTLYSHSIGSAVYTVTSTGVSYIGNSIYTYSGSSNFIGLATSANATQPTYAIGDDFYLDTSAIAITYYIVEQDGVPYEHIYKDNHKVQVDSAIRDGNGVKIDTNYAKKSELPTNKSAVSEGTDTSLVTTGEKYTWNNKQSALPTTTIANQILKSTSTSGTTQWGTLSASDVGALPSSTVIPTVNDSTITITQGGVTKGSFTLNQNSSTTIEVDAGEDISGKMDKANPTGTGSLSLNRKANTTIGQNSVAVGLNNEASAIGSHAEGGLTRATGDWSHAEGLYTRALARSQHTFGEYNILDSTDYSSVKGTYVEIVGNGIDEDARSNARTLDWSGNEVLAGSQTATSFIKSGGTSSQFLKADGSVDSSTYLTQHQDISGKQDKTDSSLQTTATTVVGAINEVNSLAKQSNKAKGFASYSALITELNSASATAYNIGQSFYIQTLNVPDLWVISVESSSLSYTYSTDSAFITATGASGGQQVGHYKIAQLETQKADLTNYSTKAETVSNVSYNASSRKLQKTINGSTTDVVTFGANAFNSTTIPTNTNQLTNGAGFITASDLPTVNNATLDIQLNGTSVNTFTANASSNVTANIQALPNYSITIGSTGGGNPRQVKFLSVNYTNYDGNNACFIKLGAMCSHGNGVSYTFLDDIFIGVSSTGTVTCDVYKFFQFGAGNLDSAYRYYGDVFYTIDTTNKVVDFYILVGQYSTANFTPYTKIGATTTTGITQLSGSPTYYSSGTRVWANGDSTTYARLSDITSTLPDRLLVYVYPVGSIYISIADTSPASFLGGSWVKLDANYALWTASSGAGNTISAGLPNISGTLSSDNNTNPGPIVGGGDSGTYSNGPFTIVNNTANIGGGQYFRFKSITFNAQNANSIYGNSTTVQPPAYKVYAWKRTA